VERLFKDIINTLHDQLILINRNGEVLDYLEASGIDPLFKKEDITGKIYSGVFPPEMSRQIHLAIQQINTKQIDINTEFKLIVQGKVHWFRAKISLQKSDQEDLDTYLITTRDITDIKQTESFYTNVLNSSISGIMAFKSVRDSEQNIIDFEWIVANKTAETIIGIPADEIVGKSLLEVMPGNKNDGVFFKYIDVVETGQSMDHEKSYELQGIYKIWFHISATKLNDGFALTFQNITKRKSAEMALARNEELFRSLFNRSGIGIALVGDDKLPFKVNKKLCDILGYPEAELYRIPVTTLTHEEDRGKDEKKFQDLLTCKKEAYQLDKRLQRKDGETIWSTVTASAVKDEDGKPSFFILMVEDISYRKQAEEALKESEARWLYALEGAGDGVWDWNLLTNEHYFSRQWKAMLGYEEAEIGNSTEEWENRVHPDDLDEYKELLEKYFQGEINVCEVEYRMRCKDGDYKWILSRGKIIERTDEGQPARMIGTHSDISERRKQQENILQLNKELEELNNRKNKLISIIGHDLRSPFTSITTLLDIIQNDWQHTFSDELKKYFELLNEKVETTYNLLESLLTWSRTHMDKVSYHPTNVMITPMIESTISLLSTQAEKKNITITFETSSATEIYADGDMIQTIIRNLISNAIKFTHPGGNIHIATKHVKNDTEISVKDTGVGISREDIDKIMHPNTSFTSYGTSGEKGTGLGLDICRDFAEKHGGKLWVTSTPGEGSTFFFNIPDMGTKPKK